VINPCRRCGRCCWNFRKGEPADPGTCEFLDRRDLRTCLVYDRRAEVGRPECIAFLSDVTTRDRAVALARDLPEDCGFVMAWQEQGLLGE
jgi:uncharacterized cysteine cluster protein YcgN (CxxCxxCC family)